MIRDIEPQACILQFQGARMTFTTNRLGIIAQFTHHVGRAHKLHVADNPTLETNCYTIKIIQSNGKGALGMDISLALFRTSQDFSDPFDYYRTSGGLSHMHTVRDEAGILNATVL